MRPVDATLIQMGKRHITFYVYVKKCYMCKDADYKSMTVLEKKEFNLSAFCKSCQDVVFNDGLDPRGTDVSIFHEEQTALLNFMMKSATIID